MIRPRTPESAKTPAQPDEDRFDLRALFRLAAWGGGAALALSLAVFATRSETGAQRLAAAYGGATQTAARANTDSLVRMQVTEETRRLSEGVRTLSADRDRLLARVTVLERNLEDVTGSIKRAPEPKPDANPASSPLPASNSITALTGPTALATANSISTIPANVQRRVASVPARPLAPVPAPGSPSSIAPSDVETTQSVATTSEFGVDIGGGINFEALRDLWTAARTTHGAALNGLRPVISVREGEKGIELRLVAGPLTNAAAAAKICAALAAGGWSCKAALFDGQKLTAR
jgi:hypothetical protein